MIRINVKTIRLLAENGDETPGIHETLTMVDALEGLAREVAGHRNSHCEVGVSFDKTADDILGEYGLTNKDD